MLGKDRLSAATAHEQEDFYTVDMTLRNFAQPPPFVARWQ
jgi:hypothetical protein